MTTDARILPGAALDPRRRTCACGARALYVHDYDDVCGPCLRARRGPFTAPAPTSALVVDAAPPSPDDSGSPVVVTPEPRGSAGAIDPAQSVKSHVRASTPTGAAGRSRTLSTPPAATPVAARTKRASSRVAPSRVARSLGGLSSCGVKIGNPQNQLSLRKPATTAHKSDEHNLVEQTRADAVRAVLAGGPSRYGDIAAGVAERCGGHRFLLMSSLSAVLNRMSDVVRVERGVYQLRGRP